MNKISFAELYGENQELRHVIDQLKSQNEQLKKQLCYDRNSIANY